jgi:S-adenosylmethionine:tRNA ribosyltransferase-isomerase
MEAEPIEIPGATARAIHEAKRDRRRVVAVGTTTTRALEWAAGADGRPRAGAGHADLFIRPGHRFRVVDALVTNFHLPRSTLLVLAAAFAGRELVLDAYRHAVAARYRFYSYGDAMLIQ